MDDLNTWSVAELWPRYSRELPYSSTTITLVSGTYVYAVPSGVMRVSRVDWVGTDGDEMGPLGLGSWETVGDAEAGALYLHVAPLIADEGGTLRLLAYGRYDTSTNLIPDDLVKLVLATSRAEAYRRMAGNRVQFQQWAASNQNADTSVNELIALMHDADNQANLLRVRSKTWQRPVPARHP